MKYLLPLILVVVMSCCVLGMFYQSQVPHRYQPGNPGPVGFLFSEDGQAVIRCVNWQDAQEFVIQPDGQIFVRPDCDCGLEAKNPNSLGIGGAALLTGQPACSTLGYIP